MKLSKQYICILAPYILIIILLIIPYKILYYNIINIINIWDYSQNPKMI